MKGKLFSLLFPWKWENLLMKLSQFLVWTIQGKLCIYTEGVAEDLIIQLDRLNLDFLFKRGTNGGEQMTLIQIHPSYDNLFTCQRRHALFIKKLFLIPNRRTPFGGIPGASIASTHFYPCYTPGAMPGAGVVKMQRDNLWLQGFCCPTEEGNCSATHRNTGSSLDYFPCVKYTCRATEEEKSEDLRIQRSGGSFQGRKVLPWALGEEV